MNNMSRTERDGVVLKSEEVEMEEVERAHNVFIQRLIVDDEGAENCYLRKFTMKPGAKMGMHRHEETDHVQYLLEGKMDMNLAGEEKVAEKGDAMYIPKELPHSYENPYDKDAVFLCVVPAGEMSTEML